MNGRTCARLRHSIIFNGFRWKTEKECFRLPLIRAHGRLCSMLLKETSCKTEFEMSLLCAMLCFLPCRSIHAEKSQCDTQTYMQRACVHTCAGPESIRMCSLCMYAVTHMVAVLHQWKKRMHSTQCTERIETNKNNVANIILWTTTLKRAEQWDICGVRNGFAAAPIIYMT